MGRLWHYHITKSHINRERLHNSIHVCCHVNSRTIVFHLYRNILQPDIIFTTLKRHAIFLTRDTAYLQHDALDILLISTNMVTQKVHVTRRTSRKPLMGKQQCTTLQKEVLPVCTQ